MMMMIGEDLFIYLFTKGGKGREIGGIRKDWEVNEGMWFSFANEAEEEEGDEVVVVNALGAGVWRAGRFVLGCGYFKLCFLSVGCYFIFWVLYTVLDSIFILLFCVHYKER
jgi:hypothetical protein